MATPGKNGKKSTAPPSKSAEKYFGSEVDLKLKAAVINPAQKLVQDEKLPDPPDLPDKKPSKDATQQESLKELTEKLSSLGQYPITNNFVGKKYGQKSRGLG